MLAIDYILQIRGLTHKDLAEQIADVHPSTVQDWFKGRRKVPQKRLDMISKKLTYPKEVLFETIDNEERMRILLMEVIRLKEIEVKK